MPRSQIDYGAIKEEVQNEVKGVLPPKDPNDKMDKGRLRFKK